MSTPRLAAGPREGLVQGCKLQTPTPSLGLGWDCEMSPGQHPRAQEWLGTDLRPQIRIRIMTPLTTAGPFLGTASVPGPHFLPGSHLHPPSQTSASQGMAAIFSHLPALRAVLSQPGFRSSQVSINTSSKIPSLSFPSFRAPNLDSELQWQVRKSQYLQYGASP